MRTAQFATCFELISNFTCTSLRDWNACNNSINFLLTLWSRMTCAFRYVQITSAIALNQNVLASLIPRIVEAYIEGRLLQVLDDGASSNPLDDPDTLREEMLQIPQIVRFVYPTCGEFLLRRFNELSGEYQVRFTAGIEDRWSWGSCSGAARDRRRQSRVWRVGAGRGGEAQRSLRC